MGIFSGLESLGLDGLSNVKLYEEEKKEEKKTANPVVKEKVVSESEFIFDKKITCPCCDKEFKTKTMKTGKARLIGSDFDLRPKYSGIDAVKYDAIACPKCGYSALTRFFNNITHVQTQYIKSNISAQFSGLPESGEIYSYDEAINRFKLALFCAVVKKAKDSEKAYTCLKTAWLFRGSRECLSPESPVYEKAAKNFEDQEMEMLKNAYEGFLKARAKEDLPICGMDETTFDFLLANLANKLGDLENAKKLVDSIILSRTAKMTIKDKARDLRDEIKNKTK